MSEKILSSRFTATWWRNSILYTIIIIIIDYCINSDNHALFLARFGNRGWSSLLVPTIWSCEQSLDGKKKSWWISICIYNLHRTKCKTLNFYVRPKFLAYSFWDFHFIAVFKLAFRVRISVCILLHPEIPTLFLEKLSESRRKN